MRNISWFPEYRAVLKFLDMEHVVGQAQGVVITQVTFKRLPRNWRCHLKGTEDGMAVIAFFKDRSFCNLVLRVSSLLETDAVYWHRDKYP